MAHYYLEPQQLVKHHPIDCAFAPPGGVCGCDGAYDDGCWNCSPENYPKGFCTNCDTSIKPQYLENQEWARLNTKDRP